LLRYVLLFTTILLYLIYRCTFCLVRKQARKTTRGFYGKHTKTSNANRSRAEVPSKSCPACPAKPRCLGQSGEQSRRVEGTQNTNFKTQRVTSRGVAANETYFIELLKETPFVAVPSLLVYSFSVSQVASVSLITVNRVPHS